jgi:hypothetical protein
MVEVSPHNAADLLGVLVRRFQIGILSMASHLILTSPSIRLVCKALTPEPTLVTELLRQDNLSS